MAVLLQTLSARLGIVAGRDLAQACRKLIPARSAMRAVVSVRDRDRGLRPGRGSRRGDRTEPAVRHSAAHRRDSHGGRYPAPLWFTRFGIRAMEAFILSLVATIGACFAVEIFLRGRVLSEIVERPDPAAHRGKPLCRDRHPRRHRDAAQPIPALGAGSDPADRQVGGREARPPAGTIWSIRVVAFNGASS